MTDDRHAAPSASARRATDTDGGRRHGGVSRRAVLGGTASAAATALAGCGAVPNPFARADDAPTEAVADEAATELAERFAPTLYFDDRERWFPTDPRPYTSESEGTTVVDGFDAFDGYVERFDDAPPDPQVFYHVVGYRDSPLAVVQYWLYSPFDQFTTNFHWHDWELLQVFVDTDTGEPQLYVASSHSRRVPNNEYLDPDADRRPRLLSELGSHSSGLSVNDDADGFQRLPSDGDIADITNRAVDELEDVAGLPLAYGLPRDEQFSLPYVVPELDGAPVYEHPDLPNVERSDLVPDDVTVRSLAALESPPELPRRETGLVFEFEGRDTGADVEYGLAPTAELEDIEAFTGPQLSFEFAVPEFAEDAVASHITTSKTPWKEPRYTRPASDITERTHRQALANRYDAIAKPSPVNRVVARVTNAVASGEAPDGEGLTTTATATELFALLESEPTAVPTFNGVAVVAGVADGDHRLTVNGAGVAPHSETVSVAGPETTVGGVDGEVPVVANERARKLAVDPSDSESDVVGLAVEDDFAGRLYDAPLSGPDAVYVHEGGAYTTEVRDSEDEVGAVRVNPDSATDERVLVEKPETGKASLATYLATLAEETRTSVAAVGDSDDGDTGDGQGGSDQDGQGGAVDGLTQALGAVAEAAQMAAERAEAGDGQGADQQLRAVATRLETVSERLTTARGSGDLPGSLGRAVENRLGQARRRTEQARESGKL